MFIIVFITIALQFTIGFVWEILGVPLAPLPLTHVTTLRSIAGCSPASLTKF